MDLDNHRISQFAHRTYSVRDCVVFRKTKERFGGLSNMAPGFPLIVNSIPFGTSEALYQACRFPYHPDVQELILRERSPMTAKMRSKPHRNKTRSDWETVRLRVMRWCLRVKLAQNWDKFAQLLTDTADKPIVEFSTKDPFWGAMPNEGNDLLIGSNVLGRLLMEIRARLKDPERESLREVEPPNMPDALLLGCPIERLVEEDRHDFTTTHRSTARTNTEMLLLPIG